MKRIETPRDLLLLREGELVWVSAVDSCGGVGPLSGDALAAPPELVGAYTARTVLLELVCAGVVPACAGVAISCGPETAEGLLRGVRSVLGQDFHLIISTEKNFPAVMTALGVTLSGTCPLSDLRLGAARAGDRLWCMGRPLSGAALLAPGAALPEAAGAASLLALPGVHGLIPVGSRGVAAEAQVLARECGLQAVFSQPPELDLTCSAGPSSCLVLAADPAAELNGSPLPLTPVGVLAPDVEKSSH